MLLNSFSVKKKYTFKVKLVSIEYFSKCDCNPKSPILVRVTYNVLNGNVKSLKMKHSFENGIIITVPIKSLDKKGNVIYDFCISKQKVKKFSTVFISAEGDVSNLINITAETKYQNIVEGTAPKTIKVN